MNVKFQSHRLQASHKALNAALSEGDEMSAEVAVREIALREKMLTEAGYQVFADEHDVMLLAA